MASNSKLVSKRKLTFFDDACNELEPPYEKSISGNMTVVMSEVIEPQYGSYVWPCAVVLAQFIWFHRKHLLLNKFVVEIGAGTALPSIVAIKCASPSAVLITDKATYARASLEENEIDNIHEYPLACGSLSSDGCKNCYVHLMNLKWGEFSNEVLHLNQLGNEPNERQFPEVILASDCFYDPSLFEDVLSTVYFLLKSYKKSAVNKQREATFYCTYQTRSLDWRLTDLLENWSLQGVNIPLETFNADSNNIALSGMPGNHVIEMLKITLR